MQAAAGQRRFKLFMDIFFFIMSEIVLGFMLQSVSCLIWLCAFYPQDISAKQFTIYSGALTLVVLLFRMFPITFGIHTILSIIAIIFIAIWAMKMNVYRSVIIGILALVIIMICEIIVYISMRLFIFGEEISDMFLLTTTSFSKVPGNISNVILFLFVSIFYVVMKSSNKDSKLFARNSINGKYMQ